MRALRHPPRALTIAARTNLTHILLSKILVAVALAALAIALVVMRIRRRAHDDATDAAPAANRLANFWGVRFQVGPGATACARARELALAEYPIDQVPVLPLVGCDSVNCRCHFTYLKDRRGGHDRREASDRRDAIRFDIQRTDRRSGDDRRRKNNVWKDY